MEACGIPMAGISGGKLCLSVLISMRVPCRCLQEFLKAEYEDNIYSATKTKLDNMRQLSPTMYVT